MAKPRCLVDRIDFLSEVSRAKYLGFLPLHNDHILGLRYMQGIVRPQVQLMGEHGVVASDVAQPGEAMNVVPATVPHTVRGLYGYWHINEEDEITIPVPLANGDFVLVLLEGMPKAGRWDRFNQFCRNCNTKLYEKGVKTGEVGIAGFWKAEEDGVKQFNSDLKLRTCKNCGTVHPLGYTYFTPQKGTKEERATMRADQETFQGGAWTEAEAPASAA